MSTGLRPAHWQTRAGECADIARAFRLKLERESIRHDEAASWIVLREHDGAQVYAAPTLADLEVWLNGYGWGFRYEPKERYA